MSELAVQVLDRGRLMSDRPNDSQSSQFCAAAYTVTVLRSSVEYHSEQLQTTRF